MLGFAAFRFGVVPGELAEHLEEFLVFPALRGDRALVRGLTGLEHRAVQIVHRDLLARGLPWMTTHRQVPCHSATVAKDEVSEVRDRERTKSASRTGERGEKGFGSVPPGVGTARGRQAQRGAVLRHGTAGNDVTAFGERGAQRAVGHATAGSQVPQALLDPARAAEQALERHGLPVGSSRCLPDTTLPTVDSCTPSQVATSNRVNRRCALGPCSTRSRCPSTTATATRHSARSRLPIAARNRSARSTSARTAGSAATAW